MNEPSVAHRGLNIDQWFDAYSGGDPIGRTEIYSAVSNSLLPLLPGYRYLKSKGIFRLSDDIADQYVTLERSKGILSLRFGLTHHGVEHARAVLFGPGTVHLKNVPLTISMYSANMGPHSRGWHLPYRVQWPIFGRDGLTRALPEISAFVHDTVVPYLQRHRSPEAIRETFLFAPRQANCYLPSEQLIFAIDRLLRHKDRLASDRDVLVSQYGAPGDRHRVEAAYETALRAESTA